MRDCFKSPKGMKIIAGGRARTRKRPMRRPWNVRRNDSTLKGSQTDVAVRPLQGRNILSSCTGGVACVVRLRLATTALPPAIIFIPFGDKQTLDDESRASFNSALGTPSYFFL